MRKAMRVFRFWMIATAGLLTACGPIEESPELQAETEALEMAPREALETSAERKAPQEESVNQCLTTTCRPGAEGDAYCSSLCGDVARCVYLTGCGYRYCCVLM
jgi:hypothetical protein